MTIDPRSWLNWELMGNPLNWVVVTAIVFIWLLVATLVFGPEEGA